MGGAWFAPLSVATPASPAPTLSRVIAVSRATFLMADHSRPAEKASTPK